MKLFFLLYYFIDISEAYYCLGNTLGSISDNKISMCTYSKKNHNFLENRNFRRLNTKTSNIVKENSPIQGGSIKTWSYLSSYSKGIEVIVGSEGRPIDANLEVWNGPDNTPFKMRIYSENGLDRPFSTVLHTIQGSNTISVRNIGQVEFPLDATVFTTNINKPNNDCITLRNIIQGGGSIRSYPFDSSVESVQILLGTDGRQINSRIELLQGPNNSKQIIELYSENGEYRPFFGILETPGSGNVIRIINTGTIEFPLYASVVPNKVNNNFNYSPIMNQ